jgi:flagellar P-ring protein precursor FlgI
LRILVTFFVIAITLFAVKIKDISSIVGVRDNQLIGYGLVAGLKGGGDGTTSQFTIQSLANMLQGVNVKVSLNAIKSKNIAAVMVTAKLPPFAKQGDKIDVIVSSIGDAKSLVGGTLLMTPLKAVDGKIYAIAQGTLSTGGGGRSHPTVATMFNGALVEKSVSTDISKMKKIDLSLKESNFKNAIAVQDDLNNFFDKKVAMAINSRTITLTKPDSMTMPEFMAKLEDVDIKYDKIDKIIIDERTGTVVAGINIKISPVIITHGDLTIKIAPRIATPMANDNNNDIGDGIVISKDDNIINSEKNQSTVANVARALQKLGAKPNDIIAIISAMKKAGAISVDVEII